MRNICRLACLFLAFAIGNCSVASAQQSWADGLVQPGRLEFGVIARGSAAARSVTLTNSTGATPAHPGCVNGLPLCGSPKSLKDSAAARRKSHHRSSHEHDEL